VHHTRYREVDLTRARASPVQHLRVKLPEPNRVMVVGSCSVVKLNRINRSTVRHPWRPTDLDVRRVWNSQAAYS